MSRDCKHCGGSGKAKCPRCDGHGTMTSKEICYYCQGDGKVSCPSCNGSGKIDDRLKK